MKKISVIIPVYNAEKYLHACITSVLRQNVDNYEIIAINDGSKDSSKEIIESYLVKFPTIFKCINQDNAGVEWARYNALQVATGKYVYFLDSDDMLADNALRVLYDTIEKNDVDIVYGQSAYLFWGRFMKRQKLLDNLIPYLDRKITPPTLMDELYMSFFGINILPPALNGNLYRRKCLVGIEPLGLKFGEDLMVNARIFPHVRSIYAISTPVLKYRIGGGTSRYMPHFLSDCKKLCILKMQLIETYGYERAERYMIVELKNCVAFYVRSRIEYNVSSDYTWLEQEFTDPIYSIFDKPLQSIQNYTELDKAIYTRNAETTWNLILNESKKFDFRKIVKNVLRKII